MNHRQAREETLAELHRAHRRAQEAVAVAGIVIACAVVIAIGLLR